MTSPSSIAKGAVRGSLWLTSANYLQFAANTLINLLVMRILDRPEVGAYVLAASVVEFVTLVGAFSLDLALIHFKDDDDGTLHDTALCLAFLLGLAAIALSVALFVALSPFAPFTREVRSFIVILGLTRPLTFMASIGSAKLETSFRYATVSVAMFAVATLPNLSALGLAHLGAGAASLLARDVGQAVLGYVVYTAAARASFAWRWSWDAAARLMRYSGRMFLTRVLEVVLQRFDRLSIGTAIGKAELGAYHNGRYLAEMGYTFGIPISRLSFNVYSRVRDDPARLEKAYRLVNFFLIRGSALIAVVLGFQARDVIIVTYGPKWLPAVPTARLLAPYAAALPILSNLIQMLYGRGMMRASVIVRAVQVAVFVPAAILAMSLGGPDATGWALLVTTLVGGALVVRYQSGIVSFSGRELFLAPALACGVASLGAVFLAPAVPGPGFLPSLARLVLVAGLYAAALAAVDRRAIAEHYRYLRAML